MLYIPCYSSNININKLFAHWFIIYEYGIIKHLPYFYHFIQQIYLFIDKKNIPNIIGSRVYAKCLEQRLQSIQFVISDHLFLIYNLFDLLIIILSPFEIMCSV